MHDDDHDKGLAHDLKFLARTADRRKMLGWMAAAGLVPLFGCSSSGSTTDATADGGTPSTGDGTGSGTCSVIPEETAGPYPGDGSNGANALVLAGIVRRDIRPSIGAATGTAEGVELTVEITLVNTKAGCAKLSGYAIYLWHCDRDGKYSMYDLTDQNYLRGVQETDANGQLTFTTVFPGCYAGRWPHIHFEVYPSLAAATAVGNEVATSQLALPQAACSAAYATAGYEASVRNAAAVTLASDNVFSDGSALELATMTGSVSDGFTAALTVAV